MHGTARLIAASVVVLGPAAAAASDLVGDGFAPERNKVPVWDGSGDGPPVAACGAGERQGGPAPDATDVPVWDGSCGSDRDLPTDARTGRTRPSGEE